MYMFFAAIKKALGSRDAPGLLCNNPEELLLSLANLCEDHMGGSSGVVSYHSCLNSQVTFYDHSEQFK